MDPLSKHVVTQSYAIPGDLNVIAPADLKLITPYVLAEQGDWFESEIHFVRRFLQPGMGVVDIGANFGLYTLTSARAVGPTGWVASFEPGSLPRGCLAQSLRLNALPQVTLHNQALSNRVGSARLGLADNSELNSLADTGPEGETVPLTTLDAESASWSRPIHFLKLDAEGEELRIVEGAQRFFEVHAPLVMFELRHGPTVNVGLIEAFHQRGFATFRHLPGLNLLVPLARDAVPDTFLLNVFAARPATVAALARDGLLLMEPAALPAPDHAAGATRLVAPWFQGRPWARSLWADRLPPSSSPDAVDYRGALTDVLLSESQDQSPALRWAFATRAFSGLCAAYNRQPSTARALTAARVAFALGERATGVHFLRQIPTPIDSSAMNSELFLPPDPRLDNLEPAGDLPAAFAVMRDESLLEHAAFSVLFARKASLPVLLRLALNPLRSPTAARRLAAARHILPLGPA